VLSPLPKESYKVNIDVFNGDADGICALLQLRLAFPLESTLITGVKRDIGLLSRVSAGTGDQVVVLDVSLDKNRLALTELLKGGVSILYMDHHYSGEIPVHPGLTPWINTDANVCTSLLMNTYLKQRFTAWAVTGAFGDNLDAAAQTVAKSINLTAQELLKLKQLGICINYNAYGTCIDDLYFAPDALYRQLEGYVSPFDFIRDNTEICQQLFNGYTEDMNLARQIKAEYKTNTTAVFILPDEKWARRVAGVWGNELVNQYPDRAHAIVSNNRRGCYQISVRAPLNNKAGADELCALFSGGGRKAAAGIDDIQYEQLTNFVAAFQNKYQ
jgi:hypothetical protein